MALSGLADDIPYNAAAGVTFELAHIDIDTMMDPLKL